RRAGRESADDLIEARGAVTVEASAVGRKPLAGAQVPPGNGGWAAGHGRVLLYREPDRPRVSVHPRWIQPARETRASKTDYAGSGGRLTTPGNSTPAAFML